MEKLKWETKKVKVKDLIQLDINPRKISETKKQKLVESLERFNLVEIPAVNTDLQIIGGNQRVTALMLVGRGEEEIDVRFPNRKLTKKEVKEYAIISNTHAGEFDFEILELEFADIEIAEIGFDIAGWEDWKSEADKLLAKEELEDDFVAPEGGLPTDIIRGDFFDIGEHRLVCGDSTDSDDMERLMQGNKADMCFTDPPYGVKYTGGTKKWVMLENDDEVNMYAGALPMIYLHTKENMTLYLAFASAKAKSVYTAVSDSDFEPHALIIWNKNHAQFGSMGSHYKQKHEPIIYAWKRGHSSTWVGANNEVTVWDINRESKNEFHPTQKPIELVGKALINSSVRDALILEPFGGSGSSMVASHKLKRRCYTMELDPKYCQVIIERMKKLDPTIKITKNGKAWNTTKIS